MGFYIQGFHGSRGFSKNRMKFECQFLYLCVCVYIYIYALYLYLCG